jgi:hypothetical protein
MQDPAHQSSDHGGPSGGEDEATRRERALKEILAESGREHEGMKSALLVVVRRGLLILALFVFCSLLSNTEVGNVAAVLVFVLGTLLIVLWRSGASRR